MVMKKLYVLFVVLLTTLSSLYAGKVITYTATEKLYETQNPDINGIYKYGFNTFIRKHTYSNGVGTIEFVKDVTQIGKKAFSRCTGLTSIDIPNSVTSIEQYAFYGCTSLTSITIPNSVTSVGEYAFYGCTSLISITIGNSVTSIGEWAFYECTGLKSVSINSDAIVSANNDDSKSLSSIFGSQVTEYILGDDVHSIRDNEFSKNGNLTSVTIGNGVTNIGEHAFDGCTCLSSITIGNSVTSIGDYAFHDCGGLKKVNYTGDVQGWLNITHTQIFDNPIYHSRNLYLNDVLLTDLVIPDGVTEISDAFAYDTCLISVTIPNSITSIGKSAFSNCTGLTSITIPNSVTSIGKSAFSNCTGLTSVTIPNSVTSIGSVAFSGCTGLTSVTIPNNVTSIGNYAFEKCTGLTSITIPNSVTSIGNYAFAYCTKLTSVVWNAKLYNTTDLKSIFSDTRDLITSFSFGDAVDTIPARLCYGMKKLTSISIGSNVKNIGKEVFSGCTSLDSVIWNVKSYASIIEEYDRLKGYYDFKDDPFSYIRYRIKSISFGNAVEVIPTNLCKRMTRISSVTIPNGIIEKNAFAGCTGLTSVTILDGVTGIEEGAFASCDGLTSIVVGSGNTIYDSRDNCNAIIATRNNTLIQGCNTTVIPNSVTSIGGYAFYGCDDLTSITIPNSVTSIGGYAFYGCTGLTSITIGNSVTSIGGRAFSGCTGLISITSHAITPPECDDKYPEDNVFAYVPNTIPVRVPCGAKDAYQSTWRWSDFENYIEIPNHSLAVTTQNEDMGSVVITQEPSCFDNSVFKAVANEGYRFVQWNDGNTDNPRTVFVTQDTAFVAEFAEQLPQYTITATCDPQQGTITGTGTYDYGTLATLEAIANKGYRFAQWNDGNTDNPRTVSVVQDTAFVAEFAEQIPQYTITATCDPQQGVVTGAGAYDYGTLATLEAIAKTGYEFDSWSNGIKDNPYSFTVVENVALKALFISTTAVDEVFAEDNTAPKKIIRDGQVYILRNGKVYTIQGQELKE